MPEEFRKRSVLAKAGSRDYAGNFSAGLFIVATPIGNLGDITLRALSVLDGVDCVACEDTRVGGGLLARYGIKKPLLPYHDHNAEGQRPKIIARIDAGEAVALISDAGMPLIADPGFKLVRDCRERGLAVTVVPGANAALTALAGSGLPSDAFSFAGFLPPKKTARRTAIGALAGAPGTLVFYEAPQRLAAALGDLAEILGADREAAIARELTKLFEETRRGTLGELAGHYAANAAKGEIVIVVGPADTAAAKTQSADLEKTLKENLRALSLRDAVAATATTTGAKKSAVYALALRLVGKDK
ncbi:MAG TPA: 16S rRNA (cytidine(1402)-2'-O)-methyltransferase [Alphaproteobacteria bacterium]|nr:16S rRNA (cytidine(1402)-2'-O)-methyltransferase [Alphaproteobacteria bacterium]